MSCIAQGRLRALALFLVAILSSVALVIMPATLAFAEDGGYPYATYNGPGTDVSKYWWTDSAGNGWSPYGYAYRNCTDYVAWKLQSLGVDDSWTRGLGNGGDWYDKAANKSGLSRGTVPKVGAAAVVPSSTPGFGGFGHVAYVEAVSKDSSGTVTTITVSEYNYDLNGNYHTRSGKPSDMHFTEFVYFGDKMTSPPSNSGGNSGGGSTSAPQIFALKRTTDPNGVRQVYAGTNTAVTEGWWIPGGDGVHTHEVVTIAQHNIVGFDKVNLPGGTQAVYTAVSDGVWESWWKPDGTGGRSKIITGLNGVKGVFAWNNTENGQFVHHLYILASDGPHEAWWKDGSDGIHLSLLTSIPGGINFTMLIAGDGTIHLFVAVPTWVYDVWWHPGLNDVQARTIINIPQGDIRMVTADTFQATGLLLYTMTSTTVWQSHWTTGSSIETYAAVVGQSGTVAIKKTNADAHQLYLATADHVQEYWWKDNGASGGGEVFRLGAGQNNVGMIDKVLDGSVQDLYTGAGNWVYETWWGGGSSPATGALFSVAH